MPSKYSVALSLDEPSMMLWEQLPIGERSKRVREAIKVADIVQVKDIQIKALREQIDINISTIRKLRLQITNLEAFGVKE